VREGSLQIPSDIKKIVDDERKNVAVEEDVI
jgi:hypothetical protein